MRILSRIAGALLVVPILVACSTASPPPASIEVAATTDAAPTVATSPSQEPQTLEPSTAPTSSPAQSANGEGIGAPVEVTIVDFAFEPATVEVAVGQVVRWSNEGGQPHNVKSADGSISSAIILREPFEWTAVGETNTEIAYVCGIHPAMTGMIRIVE